MISGIFFGLLFPVLGLMILIFSWHNLIAKIRRLKTMRKTTGIVSGFRRLERKTKIAGKRVQIPYNLGTLYAPIINFSVSGKNCKLYDENFLFFRRYKEGAAVIVYYDPESPKKSPVLKDIFLWLYIVPVTLLGGCFVFCIFPAWNWLRNFN